MATVSRIGAAQDQLLVILQARPVLAGVKVELGAPDVVEVEHVWIDGNVVEWTQERLVTDAVPVWEEFALPVHCAVAKTGGTYAETRDRALALAAEVELAVRGNETLNSTIHDARIRPGSLSEGVTEIERLVTVTVEVLCHAALGA